MKSIYASIDEVYVGYNVDLRCNWICRAEICSEVQDVVKVAKGRISLGPFKHGQCQTVSHFGKVTGADQWHLNVVILSL